MRREAIICGFGGQGVIFAGRLLGQAASLSGLESAQSSSYGSEARGSACDAGVVISDAIIGYPQPARPDVLIALSQAAYDKFVTRVNPGGAIIYDDGLVVPREIESVRQIGVPATAAATDALGRRGIANVVILAAASALTGLASRDDLKKAVEEESPPDYLEINLRAVDEGLKLAN